MNNNSLAEIQEKAQFLIEPDRQSLAPVLQTAVRVLEGLGEGEWHTTRQIRDRMANPLSASNIGQILKALQAGGFPLSSNNRKGWCLCDPEEKSVRAYKFYSLKATRLSGNAYVLERKRDPSHLDLYRKAAETEGKAIALASDKVPWDLLSASSLSRAIHYQKAGEIELCQIAIHEGLARKLTERDRKELLEIKSELKKN